MLMEGFTRVPGRPLLNACPIRARNSPTHVRASPLERTRMVLFKMLNHQVFDDISACISTGKEVCCHLQSAALATFFFLPIDCRQMSIMQQNLMGKNWQLKSTRLQRWCSNTRFGEECVRDVIRITSGKDGGDVYYKTITWLHKALTKEDANAIEKATDPGDNTKACGSEPKSDRDVDEDCKKMSRLPKPRCRLLLTRRLLGRRTKRRSKRKMVSVEKQSPQGCEERRRSWPKPIRLGSRYWPWY
ncbi:uncharacterized protein LOC115664115 isoform X2 [Syzygium oleosum]|uniref:uncharacterized protein LOC115664115 isoform X2 n=1 Tax=Syzygium oleosum TaxID=219896 RepID=UPI0024B9C0C9|nr:uncharacterized protein LOC115664115 isoform X2 [Syzygium oleosum]